MLRCLLVLTTILTLTAVSTATVQKAPLKPDADEYAVYSALLDELCVRQGVRFVLIVNQTFSPGIATPDELDPAVGELIQDYVLKGATPLGKELKLANKYQLISESQSRTMFISAAPIITISRVGFNSSRDRALVYFAFRRTESFKKEQFVTMTKGPEGWRVGHGLMRFLY